MRAQTLQPRLSSIASAALRPSRLSLLYLFILSLLIGLALVQSAFPIFRIKALDEHRARENPPRLSLLLSSDTGAFADALNYWANDRVGFRDLLIRWKNQIDYSVFGVSKKVYVGSDGWLFERATTNNRIVVERMSDADYARIEQSFARLAEILSDRGIRLVVIEYPDKSTLYPEHLPANVPELPQHGKVERLRNFLRSDRDIIFIPAQDLLEMHKGEQHLYYKTDIHVNAIGSLPVAKEIVSRIAAAEGRTDVVWHENFRWRTAFFVWGSESRFLALRRSLGETNPIAPDFYQIGTDTSEGHWITDDPRRIEYAGLGAYPVFDWQFTSQPERCPGKLPGTVLFGDSFTDSYWILGLQNYFCFLRRARTPELRLKAYIDDIPPGTRYFIFEFLDPFLLDEFPKLEDAREPTR